MSHYRQRILENLRQAIQDAEQFGLLRTEDGQIITGAIDTEHGFTLTKEGPTNEPNE